MARAKPRATWTWNGTASTQCARQLANVANVTQDQSEHLVATAIEQPGKPVDFRTESVMTGSKDQVVHWWQVIALAGHHPGVRLLRLVQWDRVEMVAGRKIEDPFAGLPNAHDEDNERF